MSELFQNKYRIQSARLQGYDYGQNGAYFITICTRDREHFFGQMVDYRDVETRLIAFLHHDNQTSENHMQLSPLGKIAQDIWNQISLVFDNVHLGEFVVMPNHVHGILIICNSDENSRPTQLEGVNGGFAGKKNPMFHQNISRVVRWYKGRCSFEMRKIDPGFGWQARFHDRIIRDEDSFFSISNYIVNNPRNWENDQFFENPGNRI